MLNKKNLDLASRDDKPVKIISRVPENFAGKLAEKIRILAYEKQEWKSLGICCEHPAGRGKEPEYWGQTSKRQVFGLSFWIHIYRSGDAERRLQSKIEKDRAKFESDLKILTDREYACEPDANTDLVAFLKTHSKSFFSVGLSAASSVNEKNPVGRPSAKPKQKNIEVVWAVSAGQILQVISRTMIATCEEPPRLGTDYKPLIRPKSETMLNILAMFEIISKGDAVSIRSKAPERRTQLDQLLCLVDFSPTSI